MVRFLTSWVLFTLAVATAPAQYFEEVGYNALQARLGAATPNGAGVRVAQVEANEAGTQGFRYYTDPNVAINRSGFSLTIYSGVGTGYSGHAGGAAGVFFGNTSMAAGITQVDAFYANDWIGTNGLGYNTANLPIITNIAKVSNHSYIGTTGNTADDEAILNRADYLVDRGKQVMVVGVGGNSPGAVSAVFGSALNAIAVGRTDGSHGSGFTTINIANRVRPDLVAPQNSVSNATPIVSAAAAMLVQVGGQNAAATSPITIKAVLMAGATKAEFGANWTRTETRPLDLVFGAGELNVNNSHLILSAGQQTTGTVSLTGWDLQTLDSNNTSKTYVFQVPATGIVGTTSAVVTWNKQYTEGSLVGTLANVDLKLYAVDANGDIIGSPLDQSISTTDNVEHIWNGTALAAGMYAWRVELNGTGTTEYAIAWQTQFTPVPEPASILGIAVFSLVAGRRARRLVS